MSLRKGFQTGEVVYFGVPELCKTQSTNLWMLLSYAQGAAPFNLGKTPTNHVMNRSSAP